MQDREAREAREEYERIPARELIRIGAWLGVGLFIVFPIMVAIVGIIAFSVLRAMKLFGDVPYSPELIMAVSHTPPSIQPEESPPPRAALWGLLLLRGCPTLRLYERRSAAVVGRVGQDDGAPTPGSTTSAPQP